MKGFAEWVTGRMHRAGLVAAALALLPPLAFASSGVLVAASLRRGVPAGWASAGIAAAILAAVGLAGQASPLAAALAALLFWLPALLLTEVLRRSGSLDTAGQAATAGALAVAGIAVLAGGRDSAWLGPLAAQMQTLLEGAGGGEMKMDFILAILPGALAASLLLASLLGLLLGMWWHASVVRPGAFGEAFRGFRLGRILAGVALAVVAGLLLTGQPGLANLLLAMVMAFLLQGLAVIHGLAATLAWPPAAMVVVYVLLVFGMSVLAPLVAAFGLVDNWVDFRGRAARAAGES